MACESLRRTILVHLGTILVDLGSILAKLGSILAELGSILDPLMDRFSCFSDILLFLLITRAQKRRLAKKHAKHMVFSMFF